MVLVQCQGQVRRKHGTTQSKLTSRISRSCTITETCASQTKTPRHSSVGRQLPAPIKTLVGRHAQHETSSDTGSTEIYLGRCAEAEGLGDGEQVQAVHVEDVLQLVAVVGEDVRPAQRKPSSQLTRTECHSNCSFAV